MKRLALCAAVLTLLSVVGAGDAQAGRAFRGGFGFHRFIGFHHPFFFRHDFFFHRGLFRPFFFFGNPAFAPVPVALDPPYSYTGYLYEQAGDQQGNCYQYETLMMMNGAPMPAWGTACMGPDGNWYTVQ